MKYRKLEKLSVDVSILGMGVMRLPVLNGDFTQINEPAAVEMIDYAINNGVNYFDTAFPYHGGNSETVLGKALKKYDRTKFYVATKMPISDVKSYEDLDRIFNIQLDRLQMEYIDFYLLHGLFIPRWNKAEKLNIRKWLNDKKAEGKIKYIGFSFHGQYFEFEEILNSYDWDFCQIQYNYANENIQAGAKGLKLASSKSIPVFVMEPLLGGALANLPEQFNEILAGYDSVDLALKWLWNKKEVYIVLTGASTLEQLKQNIKAAKKFGVNLLTSTETSLILELQEEFKRLSSIPCTDCKYCLPCPQNIKIPEIFKLYNEDQVLHKNIKGILNRLIYKDQHNASECIKCGKCERKCPQGIKIIEKLEMVHKEFTS